LERKQRSGEKNCRKRKSKTFERRRDFSSCPESEFSERKRLYRTFWEAFSILLCFLSKYLYSFPKVMLLLLNWKSLLSFLLQVILGLLRMAWWFESPIIPHFPLPHMGKQGKSQLLHLPPDTFFMFSYLKFLWIISDKSVFCDTVNNSPLKVSANLKIL